MERGSADAVGLIIWLHELNAVLVVRHLCGGGVFFQFQKMPALRGHDSDYVAYACVEGGHICLATLTFVFGLFGSR